MTRGPGGHRGPRASDTSVRCRRFARVWIACVPHAMPPIQRPPVHPQFQPRQGRFQKLPETTFPKFASRGFSSKEILPEFSRIFPSRNLGGRREMEFPMACRISISNYVLKTARKCGMTQMPFCLLASLLLRRRCLPSRCFASPDLQSRRSSAGGEAGTAWTASPISRRHRALAFSLPPGPRARARGRPAGGRLPSPLESNSRYHPFPSRIPPSSPSAASRARRGVDWRPLRLGLDWIGLVFLVLEFFKNF